jgi:hypothetical protein
VRARSHPSIHPPTPSHSDPLGPSESQPPTQPPPPAHLIFAVLGSFAQPSAGRISLSLPAPPPRPERRAQAQHDSGPQEARIYNFPRGRNKISEAMRLLRPCRSISNVHVTTPYVRVRELTVSPVLSADVIGIQSGGRTRTAPPPPPPPPPPSLLFIYTSLPPTHPPPRPQLRSFILPSFLYFTFSARPPPFFRESLPPSLHLLLVCSHHPCIPPSLASLAFLEVEEAAMSLGLATVRHYLWKSRSA